MMGIMHEDLSIVNISEDENLLNIGIQSEKSIDPLLLEYEDTQTDCNLEEGNVPSDNITNIEVSLKTLKCDNLISVITCLKTVKI